MSITLTVHSNPTFAVRVREWLETSGSAVFSVTMFPLASQVFTGRMISVGTPRASYKTRWFCSGVASALSVKLRLGLSATQSWQPRESPIARHSGP